MIARSFSLVLAAGLPYLTAGSALNAQTLHAYSITRAAEGLRVNRVGGVMTDVRLHADSGVVLQFTCDRTAGGAVDCNQLSVAIVDASTGRAIRPTVANKSSTGATVTVSRDMVGTLTVRVGNEAAGPTIRLVAPGPVNGGSFADEPISVVRRWEVECAAEAGLTGAYNVATNTAELVVAADGFVISRPTLPVDENDRLIIHVVGDPGVLRTVRVVRTSAVRAVGQFRVVGEDVAGRVRRQSLAGECGTARAELADFASGEGVFRLTTTDSATRQAISADVSFRVNPVYSGAFSFGPVLSSLRDRVYTVLADSTVAETTGGESEGAYVLAYTHFLGGPFDIEKTRSVGINPMIGISVEKPLESIFSGVTFDISRGSAYLIFGIHGREVSRLVKRDGIAVGKKLPQGFSSVPTRKAWHWGAFGGIGIDLRAAVSLFGKVLTGE